MKQGVDLILSNIGDLLTLQGSDKPHCQEQMQDLGIIHDAAIAITNGRIVDIGAAALIMNRYQSNHTYDLKGQLVMPGFVDSHTHPVFMHTREAEFAMRIAGKTYVEISQAGGGIRSTIKTTRNANPDDLYSLARKRIEKMIALGTTTLEAKSGYGLSTASELMQLEVIASLAKDLPLDIVPTFMGAHEYPEEYKSDHETYLKILIHEMIPAVAKQGIARFCDIFCEAHVFSIEESERVLKVAKAAGLSLKMHADEIVPIGGAELAAKMGCISADHLGATSDFGITALKTASVIPVLLPATLFSLRSKNYARARDMIQAGLPVAIATDYNPGSCNCDSMPLTITLSCLQMGMMPAEAITAATINAAFALGMQSEVGSLEIGKKADLTVWDIPSYNFIPYHFGSSHIKAVVKEGNLISGELCKI